MSGTEMDRDADGTHADSSSCEFLAETNAVSERVDSCIETPYVRQLRSEQEELGQRLEELQEQRQVLVLSMNGERLSNHPGDDQSELDISEAMKSAKDTIKEHIRLLGDYNEIKDIAQGLVGFLAEQRNARIKEVMVDLGFDADD